MKDEIHLDTDGAKDLDAGKHKGTAVPISAGQDKGLFIFPKYYPVTKDIYENLITKK